MGETEAFALVRDQKLVVVNLHQDETGMWFANLSYSFRAPISEWRTGRSKESAADALVQAVGFQKAKSTQAKKEAAVEKRKKVDEDLI